MIPKVIHYCWFGQKELPTLAEKCLQSWKDKLPDYKIQRWDESNFNVNLIPYVSQAFAAKKYAFVSDFARFYILYNYGGIYVDTDVEVLKSLDVFLSNKMFTGFESNETVAPGLILGAENGCELIKSFIDIYTNEVFILKDGTFNQTTVVNVMTNFLKNEGLALNGEFQIVADMAIYPTKYFAPKSFETGKTIITKDTYTIHHYLGSWQSSYFKFKKKIVYMLGENLFNLYQLLKKINR